MATYSRIEDMKLVGGGLCFDFANTVGGRVPAESGRGKRAFAVVRDKLGGYADLVTWGRRVGLLTGTEARRLLRAAEGRPDEAAARWRAAWLCAKRPFTFSRRSWTGARRTRPAWRR